MCIMKFKFHISIIIIIIHSKYLIAVYEKTSMISMLGSTEDLHSHWNSKKEEDPENQFSVMLWT